MENMSLKVLEKSLNFQSKKAYKPCSNFCLQLFEFLLCLLLYFLSSFCDFKVHFQPKLSWTSFQFFILLRSVCCPFCDFLQLAFFGNFTHFFGYFAHTILQVVLFGHHSLLLLDLLFSPSFHLFSIWMVFLSFYLRVKFQFPSILYKLGVTCFLAILLSSCFFKSLS